VAAKAGYFVGGLLVIVLLAGIFGGDKGVHDFGNFLYDAVHWIGHWLGKLGHWIGDTWDSYFGSDNKAKTT
jgi:hypothetical protein